jgi:phage tail-like protein
MPVTYGFTTGPGDILTKVPMGALYLDRFQTLAAPSTLVLVNRFPPPKIDASVECSNYSPYDIEPNSEITIYLLTQGYHETATAGPYDLTDGATLLIKIDGGYTQEIILSGLTGGAATAIEVARSISLQLKKARCYLTSADKPGIISDSLGEDSSVQFTGGTAITELGFDLSVHSGSDGIESVPFNAYAGSVQNTNDTTYALSNGQTLLVTLNGAGSNTVTFYTADFVDIANATAVEVAAVLARDLAAVDGTAAATSSEARVTITSTKYGTGSSVQVTGGTARTILGFDTSLHVGSGDFVDISAATASEVNDVLNAALVNGESRLAADDLRVRLSTTRGQVYATGAPADAMGFSSSALVECANAEPYDLSEDQTLQLKVDGGNTQTIIFATEGPFSVDLASADLIVNILNRQLSGATAALSDSGTKVTIRSNTVTSSSSVQVTGGTANTAFGFDTNLHSGAGKGDWQIAEANVDDPIEFTLYDLGSAGFDRAKVYVRTDHERSLIWDSSIAFVKSGWTLWQNLSASPDSGYNDVWQVRLSHTADFISDERVVVEVEAADNAVATLDEEYYFGVEDTRRPTVEKITAWTSSLLRVKFSEPMNRGTTPTSSLYTRDVSGRASYHATINVGGTDYDNVVQAPVAEFIDGDVGLFLGSAHARNAVNNGPFEITNRLSATMVQVDATLVDEDPADPLTEIVPSLYISPYRIARIPPASTSTIEPSFIPLVTEARAVSALSVPTGDDATRYVELVLHDDLSPSLSYKLELVSMQDEAGNEIASEYTFTSWQPIDIPGRSFDLWDMIPFMNRDEDVSQDLERLVRCFDEVVKVMLNDVDRFAYLKEANSTREEVVPILLAHLGNPLSFVAGLSTDKQRDLIPLLVPMYKQKGTAAGIEDAVSFFLGKTVTVQSWITPIDTWILGESLLGFDTIVGPSSSFARFSFYIQHPASVTLTDSDKDIIEEIVEFVRPAHTHFIGYIAV